MDNLAAHKVQGVRQAIEAKGAELRYLRKRPVTHAAFLVDACAWPFGRHRHGSSSSIRLMR